MAKERIDWLRGFLVLKHGIPSHDTFGRVFAALAPREFEAAFRRWVGQLVPALDDDTVVAIDGKSSRRSTTKAEAEPLNLISAFAADIGLVLGQTVSAEKSNEILRAVRQGQSSQIGRILPARAGRGGRRTRPDLHQRNHQRRPWPRRNSALLGLRCHDRLYKAEQWADLKRFAIVARERIVVGTRTREHRYYISSPPADATRIAHAVRSHWEVENRLHWCLDVQFNEDQSTVRTGFATNNFAIVRHIVMNLLRLNTSRKGSIKTKRMLAATFETFRAELLGVMT